MKAEIQKADIETFIKISDSFVEHDTIYQEKRLSETSEKESKNTSYKGRYSRSKLPDKIKEHASLIDEALANIRICDPAVGSGAFPVGMMNEIIRARSALTPFIKEGGNSAFAGKNSLKSAKGERESGLFRGKESQNHNKNGRDSKRRILDKGKNGRTLYHFKRHAIERCLYGVDIDPGAIEIAKLRLWLSLVVDEEDREKVQPLPNLDYKMVCGNSLLGVEKDLFNVEQFNELEKLKPLYFNKTNPKEKKNLKEQIDKLISQITSGHKAFDFEVYFSEVFHEKKGFDVVIANPPYISHDEIQNKKHFKKMYKAYEPFADLYCYFLETALNIQNKTGILCYITSNSYLRAEYGKPLRDLLLEKNHILNIINIEEFQVFYSAIVNTSILISKNQDKNTPKCLVVNSRYKGGISFENFIDKNKFYYLQNQFQHRAWYLLQPKFLPIKKKIESAGKTLEMYNTKIRLGIATGANNVFVIDEKRKINLINQDKNNANIIKPILRGQNIFKFKYQFKNQYLILAKNGINIQKNYPAIYSYFNSFGDSFKKRGAQGEHWFNLRATAFLNDFKKEKIIWIELTNDNRFALCSEEIYLLNSAYFLLPPKEFLSKYLLALLNSKLIKFYLGLTAETSGMGVNRWINNYVKNFPIPKKSITEQNVFVVIIDKILSITKAKDYLKNPAKQAKVREYEKQIDQLIYKLYGLTSAEIKIIEQEAK